MHSMDIANEWIREVSGAEEWLHRAIGLGMILSGLFTFVSTLFVTAPYGRYAPVRRSMFLDLSTVSRNMCTILQHDDLIKPVPMPDSQCFV